jgi:hypothetical protein
MVFQYVIRTPADDDAGALVRYLFIIFDWIRKILSPMEDRNPPSSRPLVHRQGKGGCWWRSGRRLQITFQDIRLLGGEGYQLVVIIRHPARYCNKRAISWAVAPMLAADGYNGNFAHMGTPPIYFGDF